MPLYDYVCEACSHGFERLVRGDTLPTCPACGSAQVTKLLSKPAAPGKTAGILSNARRQAAREGHFSNYKPSERPRHK